MKHMYGHMAGMLQRDDATALHVTALANGISSIL